MKKILNIIINTFAVFVLFVIILPLFISFVLQNVTVQNIVLERVTRSLTENLGSEISIDKIDLKLFYRVNVKGFYVESPVAKDTLLYVGDLETKLKNIDFKTGKISLGYVNISNAKMYLNTDSTSILNMKYITQKFKSKKKKEKKSGSFMLDIDAINIDSMDFAYSKYIKRSIEYGVNFDDMRFCGIDLDARNFSLIDDSMSLRVDNISFKEKSGFDMKKITAKQLIICSHLIEVNSARILAEESHLDLNRYSMYFSDWVMSDYINKVKMEAVIESSSIDFRTITHFTGRNNPWRSVLSLSGYMSGTVSDMRGEVWNVSTNKTIIDTVTFALNGLPNIKNTNFNVHVSGLKSTIADIGGIYHDFTGRELKYPNSLDAMGKLSFHGAFDGKFSEYKSSGIFNTEIGNISLNLNNIPVKDDGANIDGTIRTIMFNAGRLARSRDLGSVAFEAGVKGVIYADSVNLNTSVNVHSMKFKGYNYTGIDVSGNLVNKRFFGNILSSDPNIDFEFKGYLDLSEKIPSYDFHLDIKEADLYALNFNRRDSVSLVRGNLTAHGSGTNIDNLNGDIFIDGARYINHIDTINIGNVFFDIVNQSNNRSVKMTSDFADIDLRGRQSYNNIIPYFENTIKKYLPSLQKNLEIISVTTNSQSNMGAKKKALIVAVPDSMENPEDSYYILSMNVKKANNVAGIFAPGLNVAEGTKLSFMFNPALNQFSLGLDSEYIRRGTFSMSKINVDSRNMADSISLFMRAGEMEVNNIYVPNLSLIGGVKNDNISLSTRFFNSADNSSAFIRTMSVMTKDSTGTPKLRINVLPSLFTLDGQTWNIGNSRIYLDTTSVDVKNFNFRSSDQTINIDGRIGRNETDTLKMSLNKFNLQPFTKLVESMGYRLAGQVDGSVGLISVMRNMYAYFQIDFKNVALNDKLFSDTRLSSRLDPYQKRIRYMFGNNNDTFINGYFDTQSKIYSADVNIDSIDLSLLSPLMAGISTNTSGTANIGVNLSNVKGRFGINGKVEIPSFSTKIGFTNVGYTAKGDVSVKDSQFELQNGTITDELGVESSLEASLRSNNFKNVHYNISAKPNRMLCLNTTSKENNLFFGKVFATGDVSIKGIGRNVTMNAAASTDDNTVFNLLLTDKATISEADFITFVTPKNEQVEQQKKGFIVTNKKEKNNSKSSFAINLSVNVLPNAEAVIAIVPNNIENTIKARGSGQLIMNIVPSRGIFSINGGYELDKGTYRFALRNMIDKLFTIKSGSHINWTGDPLQANMNITAIYKVKTSLAPLLGNDPTYNKRVEVDCNLTLLGQILKPDINLGISIPNADPETQSLISSALNTEESISTQLIWLLLSNSFMAEANTGGGNVNVGLKSSAAVTGIEFLSNQLSNWISNDKFNIGINYRPKNELTSDEVELAFSTSLLKNKLYLDVEGNYDFKNNNAYTTDAVNNLSGDFYLTWVLDSKGNLRTKVFSRTITTFDENQGLQESGIGLYYKEDFNRFMDLLRKYKEQKYKRKQKKEQKNSNANVSKDAKKEEE